MRTSVSHDSSPEMTAADVIHLLDVMERAGVSVWIDGGWAVDANLGEQTRPHRDLDIVIEEKYVSRALHVLERLAFGPVEEDDAKPWNFVLANTGGHQVDFHVVVLAADGRGLYGPQDDDGDSYPAESLTGVGTIVGRTVRCTTPEALVGFHTGYDLGDTDWADVKALCERFDIPIPDEYDGFS